MSTVYHATKPHRKKKSFPPPKPGYKYCNDCEQEKLIEEFVRSPRYPGGRKPRCKVCQNKYAVERRAKKRKYIQPPLFILSKKCNKCGKEKAIEEFSHAKKGAYGYSGSCKQCDALVHAVYRQENLETLRAREKQYSHDRYWGENEENELYREMVKDARDRWNKRNPLKRHEQTQRYQARKKQVMVVEPVSYEAILERDGMWCYICQSSILPEQEIHFDHVVPLSRGGIHATENIAVTHAICNVRKKDLLLAELTARHRRGVG